MGPLADSKIVPTQLSEQRREIFYEGYLYDVTDWIPKHPGGNIIKYYTDGKEDATIPIQQFHQRSIKQVLAKMKTLPNRAAENYHQTERHRKLTEDFQKLYQDLLDEGFFEPSPLHVFCRLLEILTYFGFGVYFSTFGDFMTLKLLGLFLSSLSVLRSGWFMHEGGHKSLTGNPKYDRILEKGSFSLGMGLSASWWGNQHNRHHAMPQRVHRDVDMNTLPLLAFSSKIAKGHKYGNTFFTRHQAKLFFTLDTFLVICFWKFYLHPKYVIQKRKYDELLMMLVHYIIFVSIDGWSSYAISLWFIANIKLGTFALSHTHMPVTTENLHWVEYSLLHTTDVEPSWWCDWVMGYLNYQIEHHLFPTMPQFRQRRIVSRVKALAAKHGIPYQCMSYTEAIRKAIENLAIVSKEIVEQKDA